MSRSPITRLAIVLIPGIVAIILLTAVIASNLSAITEDHRPTISKIHRLTFEAHHEDADHEAIAAVNAWLEKHRDAVICLDGTPKKTNISVSISEGDHLLHQIDCIEALIAASSDPIKTNASDGATGGGG